MSDLSKVWRLLPLLAALMLMMGSAYVSCSYNTSPNVSAAPVLSFATELELQDANGQQSRTFASGEPIHMTLKVRKDCLKRLK